jgi:hypothetical protein
MTDRADALLKQATALAEAERAEALHRFDAAGLGRGVVEVAVRAVSREPI